MLLTSSFYIQWSANRAKGIDLAVLAPEMGGRGVMVQDRSPRARVAHLYCQTKEHWETSMKMPHIPQQKTKHHVLKKHLPLPTHKDAVN